MIDLNRLYNKDVDKLDITNKYTIPEELIVDERIKELSEIDVDGYIKLETNNDLEDELYVSCNISGTMKLLDSISLDLIDYDFSIEYDDFLEENFKNNENSLDIFEFLWENIELEVPIKFTKVENYDKFSNKDWKLIDEGSRETSKNNPFKELLDDYKEE